MWSQKVEYCMANTFEKVFKFCHWFIAVFTNVQVFYLQQASPYFHILFFRVYLDFILLKYSSVFKNTSYTWNLGKTNLSLMN
jgi:hypothetical protein